MTENGEGVNQGLNTILAGQAGTAELFPRISKHLTDVEPIEEANESQSSSQYKESIIVNQEPSSAMKEIGITDFPEKESQRDRHLKEYQ